MQGIFSTQELAQEYANELDAEEKEELVAFILDEFELDVKA